MGKSPGTKKAPAIDKKPGNSKNSRGNLGIKKTKAVSKVASSRKWKNNKTEVNQPFKAELFSTVFSKENIEKLVSVTKIATETEVKENRKLLPDDFIYSLQITSHRAAHVPVHVSKISLPHSVESGDADICLFVKDLKRGRKLDVEPTVTHYEELLRSKGFTKKITIIPISQLYNEFSSFEMRRKLTHLYDRFLVDKPVATHVNGFLGKKLMSKGYSAVPVDLTGNIPNQIESALKKVFYKNINSGNVQMVRVGRHSMTNEQISENVIELITKLGTFHPGGSSNIHKLHLKPNVDVSVAVTVYVNIDKCEIDAPVVTGPQAQIYAEISKVSAANLKKFKINKLGVVMVKKRKEKGKKVIKKIK